MKDGDVYNGGRALELLGAVGAVDEVRANLDVLRAFAAKPEASVYLLFQLAAALQLKELLPLLLDHLDDRSVGHPGQFLLRFWNPDERRAALKDPDPRVRSAAAFASFEDPSALEPLLRDPEASVRLRIARTLAFSRDERAGPILFELAKDPDPALAAAAAESYWHNPRSIDPLEVFCHPSQAFKMAVSPNKRG